jgi:RHS repeat-associated protein
MEKRGDAVIYLSTDQISSTSLTTDANGAEVSQVRYDPYGAVRWSSGTLPTDKNFTGQRSEGFGLMDYKARYYSSDLEHFIHLPRWKCNVVFKKQGRLYEKEY